jgi:hypothetical protein
MKRTKIAEAIDRDIPRETNKLQNNEPQERKNKKTSNASKEEMKPRVAKKNRKEDKTIPSTHKKNRETPKSTTVSKEAKTIKKTKVDNDVLLKRIIKIESHLKKISQQLEIFLKTTQKDQKAKKNKDNTDIAEEGKRKKSNPTRNVKSKSATTGKEDTHLSFKFKVFFKKTDDMQGMREKSNKIASYMNAYLGSQAFKKKYGLLNATTTTSEKETKNPSPILMDTILKEQDKECIFKFRVNLLKNTGARIGEKTIGSIVESVQDKLFHAENTGWCSGFVYDVE